METTFLFKWTEVDILQFWKAYGIMFYEYASKYFGLHLQYCLWCSIKTFGDGFNCVTVFYRCITNYQKLSGLKQYLLCHHFCGSEVQAWLRWLLCLGPHRAMTQVPARPTVSFKTQHPIPSSLVVGRIQFLVAAVPRSSAPKDCLMLPTTWLSQ